jgi:hypothetical protein
VPELYRSLKKLVDRMRAHVTLMVEESLLDRKLVGSLRSRVGYANALADARHLCRLLGERWPRIARRTALRAVDLDELEAAASALAAALAERSPESDETARASELRMRAFTRFVDAYDQARRAIAYIRWSHGDADRIVPSLFARRKPKTAPCFHARTSADSTTSSR